MGALFSFYDIMENDNKMDLGVFNNLRNKIIYMPLVSLNAEKNKDVINRLAGGEFLQSTIWFDLLHREGEEAEFFGFEEGGEIKALALIIKKKILGPFSYYYLPRGPLGEKEAIRKLLGEFKKIKPSAMFFRVEPIIDIFSSEKEFAVCKTVNLQPQKTLRLDLSLSETELLSAMHPKTRYNIRLADKKGVRIYEASRESFASFWELMKKTGTRDGFRLHSQAHYANLLSAGDNIKMFLAEHSGRIIAGGLFSFFGDRVTYLHGASDNEQRNLMAPYLLQWTVIREAQRINETMEREVPFRYYDFYGIDEKKWPGVTRFKLGFGGEIKEYPGTYDIVSRPVIYRLYGYLRRLRRLI